MSEAAPIPADDFRWASPTLRDLIVRDPAAALRDRGVNVPPSIPLPVVHEFIRVAYLLWVEGKLTPVDQFHIDPADEGLLFGRGAWASTRTVAGIPWMWPFHLDRLRQTAEQLHIELPPARLPDSRQVGEYVRGLTSQDLIVRLNVTAGRPGHGGLVWMSAAPLPEAPPSLRLRACRLPFQKGHAYLTLKTFHYAARMRIGWPVLAGQLGTPRGCS
jgi:hypothetical protein